MIIQAMANPRFFFCCLLFALCTISASADVFVSIDCGSSVTYKDENGIVWTGDDDLVQNGESHSVQSSNSISPVVTTLRVFTTHRKNCYHIDSVKRGRVLLRATFYYGNYDNKSSPPTFDLQFDGNHWETVKTSSSQPVWYEVIYVTKRDSISICVANTNPGEFPFVSALEVRGLETYMYQYIDERYPLFLSSRIAFGSNATIRYQEDLYDRIWSPDTPNNGSVRISSDIIFDVAVRSPDRPPPAVLKNAITATSHNKSLVLPIGFPPGEFVVYINWYFSEITQLNPNQTRSFRIFRNNLSFSEPIIPPYQNSSQYYISNHTVTSNTTFSLVPTNDSTLPPLINALELFVIRDELTIGTNTKDVQGLASLQKAFGTVLEGWSGDPCYPPPYSWEWIDCTVPRVTALFLGSFSLSGLLPNFSSMDALQTIDLHNNSLLGHIPDFLGTLPNLKLLNLSNNKLNGTIPASLLKKKGLELVVTGNPDLCTPGTLCPDPSATPPVSSSISKKKNVLELLFNTIISCIIILQLMT